MTSVDPSLQAQVDAQLLEQGAFAPLELLLNSGRLLYSDYEAWRRREIEFLDGALMGNTDKIKAEMERAASYARRIGLVEQPQEFHAWHSETAPASAPGTASGAALALIPAPPLASVAAARPLRISLDTQLQRLIGSRYIRAQSVPQMDLFFDNPVVALTNGIVRALGTRNLPDAQRQLDQLYAQAPTHPDLAAFDQLLEALGRLGHPVEDPREESAFLLEVTPTARRLLGAQSRDLLSPLWRQVADAQGDTAFNPADPALHRSFALAQAQDWAAVSDSVTCVLDWQQHPVLCQRQVESAFNRRRRVEALAAWCQVCWRDPTGASAAVTRLRQPELTTLWNRFLDEEEPLQEADFPSWLLLQEPGLVLQLAEDLPAGETAAEQHYGIMHGCIRSRRAKRQDEELRLRKRLQESNPALFQLLKRSA